MLNNKRILIVRLSSIGDVLHATPVAKALKDSYPSCHLTWIVSRTAASLIEENPYVDEIFIWSREDLDAAVKNRRVSQLKRLWRQLKDFYHHNSFDVALDVHGLFLTGAILFAGNAPRRIGMAKTRELNRFFMTEQAPAPQSEHVIARYLSVLQPLGIHCEDSRMTLTVPREKEAFAEQFLLKHGITAARPVVMINPKTSWQSKNWDIEHFAKCLRQIDKTAQIIICGGPQDKREAAALAASAERPVVNAAGKTSLLELAALLKKAAVLLTGDTGALHMAIAVGTRTVSLWGPTRPQQYGPLSPEHKVLVTPYSCSGCHKAVCRLKTNACMAAISPEIAASAINAMLKSPHSTGK